jgi:hypothetical protein
MTATIWRTCPSCGAGFEQPDDPGRKRVYCSRACQQAAHRARQRTSAGQHRSRQEAPTVSGPAPEVATLANRLVGILHGCLRHRQPYDEQVAWPTSLAVAA